MYSFKKAHLKLGGGGIKKVKTCFSRSGQLLERGPIDVTGSHSGKGKAPYLIHSHCPVSFLIRIIFWLISRKDTFLIIFSKNLNVRKTERNVFFVFGRMYLAECVCETRRSAIFSKIQRICGLWQTLGGNFIAFWEKNNTMVFFSSIEYNVVM